MTLSDLPAVLSIQASAYPPALVEDIAAIASRVTLPASRCLAATTEGTLVGYLIAHYWPADAPPRLNTVLTSAVSDEVLYIHDLAVARAERGSGLGQRLVKRAIRKARRDGRARAELVAVEGAAPFWRTLGFDKPKLPQVIAPAVSEYGPNARWMVRELRLP